MKTLKRILPLTAVIILIFFYLCGCGNGALYYFVSNEPNVEAEQSVSVVDYVPVRPLRFKNGEFKIVQVSDFHEWLGIERNLISVIEQFTLKEQLTDYLDELLEAEKPDLVVLTGDNMFSLKTHGDIALQIGLKTYRAIADYFNSRGQFWTLTFGNHDEESVYKKEELYKEIAKGEFYVGGFTDGDYYKTYNAIGKDEKGLADNRFGNTSVQLYDSEGERVIYNVFTIDSGSYHTPALGKENGYRYIRQDQTEWYNSEKERLAKENANVTVPSVIFTHIPLWEHREAYFQNNVSIGEYVGISPSNTRSTIFQTALKNGDVRAIFTGHNHQNSFAGFYKTDGGKIMLGVTPQCAANAYGKYDGTLGSRTIILKENGDLTTYVSFGTGCSDLSIADGIGLTFYDEEKIVCEY